MSIRELLGRMELDKVRSTVGRINVINRLRAEQKMWETNGRHHGISLTASPSDIFAMLWVKPGVDPDPLCQMFLTSNFLGVGYRFEYPPDSSPSIVLAQSYALYNSELAILN